MWRPRSGDVWFALPGCLAAYQAIGAPNLPMSYMNVRRGRMGIYTSTVVIATPAWTPELGWTFTAASDNYLTTGVSAASDENTWSAIVRFSGVTNAGALFGARASPTLKFQIIPNVTATIQYGHWDQVAVGPALTAGVCAISGLNGYRNALAEATLATAASFPTRPIMIGACCAGATGESKLTGSIQALAIYNRTLTDAEVWRATKQINYCEYNPEWNAWAPPQNYWFMPALPTAPSETDIELGIAWNILIDWNLDGEYTDESAYTIAPLSIERGRSSPFDEVTAAKLTLTLNNNTRRFDPWYGGSPLTGTVLPRRPVIIRATYDGNTSTLFVGKVEDIRPTGGLGNQIVTITAYDGLRDLNAYTVEIALLKSVTTDAAIDDILDAVGWSVGGGYRALDTGSDTLAYWWCDETALNAIQELALSEGGAFFISHSGQATFYSRDTMILGSSKMALDEDHITDIVVTQPWDLIRNSVTVRANPLVVAASGTIWQLEDEAVSIAAGQSITLWAKYYDSDNNLCPADTVIPPAVTTDYTANATQGGGGADMTSKLTVTATIFSRSAKLVCANTHATATLWITLLKIRGQAITPTPLEIKVDDTTSQAAYGKRTLDIDVEWQQSALVAMDYAQSKLNFYKDPQKGAVIRLEGRPYELFNLDIFDRIDFTSGLYSIDESMRIGAMAINASPTMQHLSGEFTLESADNTTYWLLEVAGNSELGVTTRLGY